MAGPWYRIADASTRRSGETTLIVAVAAVVVLVARQKNRVGSSTAGDHAYDLTSGAWPLPVRKAWLALGRLSAALNITDTTHGLHSSFWSHPRPIPA